MSKPQIWIDVSHWETERGDTKAHVPFDWVKFRATGGSGATIRATHGGTLLGGWKPGADMQYNANIVDAHAANGDAVSYHLHNMRAGKSPEQVEYYFGQVDLMGRPPMLDCELEGNATVKDILTWLDSASAIANMVAWLYASPSWIKKYIPVTETSIRRFPLILANYDAAAPLVTGPFLPSDVAGWQCSQRYYAPAWGVANGNKGCALYEMYDLGPDASPTPPTNANTKFSVTGMKFDGDGTVTGKWKPI